MSMATSIQFCLTPAAPIRSSSAFPPVLSGGRSISFSSALVPLRRNQSDDKASIFRASASSDGGGSSSSSSSSSSSLDTVAATVGQVTEVSKDTFWSIVKAAGDRTVVLDMYTQWCGPCKVMAPKFKELSEKYLDVIFLKLDCNQENKPLAQELGIRVVPTFKILKDSKIVKEVTGAKFDDLVLAIETVRSS